LNHKIEVQALSMGVNTTGEPTRTYTTYLTLWGQVTQVTGREAFLDDQVKGSTSHRVRVRYSSAISVTDRLKVSSRYLYINALMNPNDDNEMLDIFCTEAV